MDLELDLEHDADESESESTSERSAGVLRYSRQPPHSMARIRTHVYSSVHRLKNELGTQAPVEYLRQICLHTHFMYTHTVILCAFV